MVVLALSAAVMVGCKHKDSNPAAPVPPVDTATSTPTITRTSTLVPTATRTFTATSSATSTPTSTPSATLSATPTKTASFTPTVTATATLTSTPTETATVTFTPTSTGTIQATQAPVNLNSAAGFVVLAYAALTNSGATSICGDLGLSPGTSQGAGYLFGCGGVEHITDGTAATAQGDVTTAYNDAAGRTNPTLITGDLGGLTLTPGLYQSNGSLEVTSADLVLDGQNAANPVFIFQIATTLSAASARSVLLINGAKPSQVYWQVGTSCAFDTTSSFVGTIMAYTQIAFNTGAVLNGRAFSMTAQVTMLSNTITMPTP